MSVRLSLKSCIRGSASKAAVSVGLRCPAYPVLCSFVLQMTILTGPQPQALGWSTFLRLGQYLTAPWRQFQQQRFDWAQQSQHRICLKQAVLTAADMRKGLH